MYKCILKIIMNICVYQYLFVFFIPVIFVRDVSERHVPRAARCSLIKFNNFQLVIAHHNVPDVNSLEGTNRLGEHVKKRQIFYI